MSDRLFVDTNVLVYAHDRGSGAKHDAARDLVQRLWDERSGVLSTQVLQELCVNLQRQAARPLETTQIREIVDDYLSWHVVVNDERSVLGALDLGSRYEVSFWDALILHAANRSRARVLYSEDFNAGQVYGDVEVVNPFAQAG